MEEIKIAIPNPKSDLMGDSLRSLLNTLEQWHQRKEIGKLIIDMEQITFVHPFLILPLCALIAEKIEKNVEIQFSCNEKIKSYLETILFPKGLDTSILPNWQIALEKYTHKTYLPVCKIPSTVNATKVREQLLTTFENILIQQLKITGQLISVIKYLIGEAIDNITDHSEVHNGWIMAQNYPSKGYLDVCIVDNGIGINGSYTKSDNFYIENDADALRMAINGESTKIITETRGYGIDTSRRMLVDGMKGKYLLFSGKAFYIYSNELEQIIPLPDIGWHGTMLAMQIPAQEPENFNYITFLE
jgi:anti-sigma regulatory factor (Ser/Thr protein kinase)